MKKEIILLKIGGAAITHKLKFETIDQEIYDTFINQIAEAWALFQGRIVIVHGAGSFGHFQAKKYDIQNCDLSKDKVPLGFCETRLSVTKLNVAILTGLIERGIPAVSVPALPNWTTLKTKLHSSSLETVEQLIDRGFLPLLHGDGVIDHAQGCAILSGDVIMRELAINSKDSFKPSYVIFMTNVFGIYDKPPEQGFEDDEEKYYESQKKQTGAQLLRHVQVSAKNESLIVWKGETHLAHDASSHTISTECDPNDATGGMATKIREVSEIARQGVPVLVVKAGSKFALNAILKGKEIVAAMEKKERWVVEKEWRGTICSASK